MAKNAKLVLARLSMLVISSQVMGCSPVLGESSHCMTCKNPRSRKELETFSGIAVYFAKFIPNLLSLSAPLRELLEKGVEFQWNENQLKAFHDIIDATANTESLQYYDKSKQVTLATDASNTGFGTMISQDD